MPSGSGRPVISGENLLAEFAPEIGGRLTRLVYRGEDIIVPLLDDDFDPLFWPKAGGYPLIPYHNRIEAGRLAFAGQQIPLKQHPGALPHTLHGPAQRQKWRVGARSENAIEMVLDYGPDADWPWAFRASQRFEIGEGELLIRLSVVNTGDCPMPSGLGWHPYFAGGEVEHDARFWWPHDGDLLPTGQRVVRKSSDLPLLGPTHYFSGWEQCRLSIGQNRLRLTASPELGHLVLHRADRYLCIEPVTHVANGFNLAEAGVLETGDRTLQPGEPLAGSILISFSRSGLKRED